MSQNEASGFEGAAVLPEQSGFGVGRERCRPQKERLAGRRPFRGDGPAIGHHGATAVEARLTGCTISGSTIPDQRFSFLTSRRRCAVAMIVIGIAGRAPGGMMVDRGRDPLIVEAENGSGFSVRTRESLCIHNALRLNR